MEFWAPLSRTGEFPVQLVPMECLNPLPSGFCAAPLLPVCLWPCPTSIRSQKRAGWYTFPPEMRNILGPTTLSLSLGGPPTNRVMLQQKCNALAWNLTLRLKMKTSHLYKCFVFLLRKYCISILSIPATVTEWQNFGLVSVLLVLNQKGVSPSSFFLKYIFLKEPTLHFNLYKSCWKLSSTKYFNISFAVVNLTVTPQSLVYKQGISRNRSLNSFLKKFAAFCLPTLYQSWYYNL